MTVNQLDPIRDPRWAELVDRHPKASIFHTPGWLEALRRTYGYQPVAYTTAAARADLTNGLVVCRVHSPLTGNRIVSLPFSDHCEALVDNTDDLDPFLDSLEREVKSGRLKYLELRPVNPFEDGRTRFGTAQTFYCHNIDLRPSQSDLFRSFARTRCQQTIKKAERMEWAYEEGRSESLLAKFYGLFLKTRRRHCLPPPPMAWFQNVIHCLKEKVKIRVVSKEGVPAAGLLTLIHNGSIVDKYSCSDERFYNLGGASLLLWRAIQEAQSLGLASFDLGRSDCDAEGLINFKEGWHATRRPLTYYRYPAAPPKSHSPGWKMRVAQRIFARLPDPVLATAGTFLYRHAG